jgi:hypothetical protein
LTEVFGPIYVIGGKNFGDPMSQEERNEEDDLVDKMAVAGAKGQVYRLLGASLECLRFASA